MTIQYFIPNSKVKDYVVCISYVYIRMKPHAWKMFGCFICITIFCFLGIAYMVICYPCVILYIVVFTYSVDLRACQSPNSISFSHEKFIESRPSF